MLPEALKEARDWLTRAERDLLAATRSMEGATPLPDIAVYHAQQAAEKAVKAFLAAHDRPFPKTHNVVRLVQRCRQIDRDFHRYLAAARTLSPYAALFRYPGGPLEPETGEAEEDLRLATEMAQFVRSKLAIEG